MWIFVCNGTFSVFRFAERKSWILPALKALKINARSYNNIILFYQTRRHSCEMLGARMMITHQSAETFSLIFCSTRPDQNRTVATIVYILRLCALDGIILLFTTKSKTETRFEQKILNSQFFPQCLCWSTNVNSNVVDSIRHIGGFNVHCGLLKIRKYEWTFVIYDRSNNPTVQPCVQKCCLYGFVWLYLYLAVGSSVW